MCRFQTDSQCCVCVREHPRAWTCIFFLVNTVKFLMTSASKFSLAIALIESYVMWFVYNFFLTNFALALVVFELETESQITKLNVCITVNKPYRVMLCIVHRSKGAFSMRFNWNWSFVYVCLCLCMNAL